MTKIAKPNFAYQPFQEFVESGGLGAGPKLMIEGNPGVLISLSGWQREKDILYILDFIYDSKAFGSINFFETKYYFINKVPVYPAIFIDKIINLAKEHPALMDFILWNLL